MHPLFREPLRYDALSWVWLVLVAAVCVLHLRLSSSAGAWPLLLAGVVVPTAFVLVVALVRYLVTGPQRRVRGARTVREVLGIDILPGVGEWRSREAAGERPGRSARPADDVDAAVAVAAPEQHRPQQHPTQQHRHEPAVPMPSGHQPAPAPALVSHAPDRPAQRPRALRIEVDEVRVAAGTPVTVTWSFEGADSVVVDGRTGFPSHGQTTVALRHTRPVVLIGASSAGVTAVSTPEVEVVAEPPSAPTAPAVPPAQRLQLDLRAHAEGAETVLARLDRVMRAQDDLRPYTAAPSRPPGVPAAFTRWLRSHPQQRYVGAGSYLDALRRPPDGAGASTSGRTTGRTDGTAS